MAVLPPLGTLRVFDAAARHLNMRLAADDLGVTHGAIAQQIRALEASLGVKLFERGPQGLTLTSAGTAFHGPVRRAFALITGAVAAMQPARGGQSRSVTVTVMPSFAARWLIPRMGRFSARAPQVELRVLASERQETLGMTGAPDLGIRLVQPPFDASIDARLLFHVKLFPVCSPAVAKTLHTMQSLAKATLLHDAQPLWAHWLGQVGGPVSVKTGLRFSHSALALDAALDGQGVAIGPFPLVADDLARGLLVAPFGTDLSIDSGRSFYVVTPKHSRIRDDVSAFREWLMTEAASIGQNG